MTKKFPQKGWSSASLDWLIQKIDTDGTSDRRPGSSRPCQYDWHRRFARLDRQRTMRHIPTRIPVRSKDRQAYHAVSFYVSQSWTSILKRTKSGGKKAEQRLQAKTLRHVSAVASAIPERRQKLSVMFYMAPPIQLWKVCCRVVTMVICAKNCQIWL